MKKADMSQTLQVRPRDKTTMLLELPTDTLSLLTKVAARRDMSPQALLKLYVGQGLRHDAAQLYADRVLETTAQVLSRHLQSDEAVAVILREIQGEVTAQTSGAD